MDEIAEGGQIEIRFNGADLSLADDHGIGDLEKGCTEKQADGVSRRTEGGARMSFAVVVFFDNGEHAGMGWKRAVVFGEDFAVG